MTDYRGSWTPSDVKVHARHANDTREPGFEMWPAYVSSEFPGLAIVVQPHHGHGCNVTHILTGKAIEPNGLSFRDARMWAEALAPLHDWAGKVPQRGADHRALRDRVVVLRSSVNWRDDFPEDDWD